MSQTPFLFNITGGVGGQAGIPYIAGQVEADFVDRLKVDPMSAERQRINWAIPETQPLLRWGEDKVKQLLLVIWANLTRGSTKMCLRAAFGPQARVWTPLV